MTREEFIGLPPAVALGLLWDNVPHHTLGTAQAPKLPRPPKYDATIYRKDGVQWASETDVEGLRFWHDRNAAGANDPKYGEKNRKAAERLAYWIAWRQVEPSTAWRGLRNDVEVTAAPPAAKPAVHPRQEQRAAPQSASPPQHAAPDLDGSGDDDIPFILNVTSEPEERWWKPKEQP